MAKLTVGSWDSNSANNTDIAGIDIAENCPSAGINDSIRNIMSQIKTAFTTVAQLLSATDFLFISPKTLFDAGAWFSLTDAATISIDQNSGLNFTVTLAGNRAMANLQNKKVGSGGFIRIVQDATGSRTLTWGTDYKFPAALGSPPSLSSGPGQVDLFSYIIYDATTVYVTGAKTFS